jgi:hypothetical protein
MAAALGVMELWRAGASRSGMRVLAIGVAVVYSSLLALSLFNYYGNPRFGKEQWREVFAYLERETPRGTQALIVFEPDFIRVAQDYYGQRPMPRVLVDAKVKNELLSSPGGISELGRRADLVWLIRSHEVDDLLLDAFRGAMHEQSHLAFPKANGIDVYRFDNLPQVVHTIK